MLGIQRPSAIALGWALVLGGCADGSSDASRQAQRLQAGVDYEEFVPAIPVPAEPPPLVVECDPGPHALLHDDCPRSAPALGACDEEGLECLYDSGDGCADRYDCTLGFWTALGIQCPEEARLNSVYSDEDCSATLPIAGSPCQGPLMTCGYGYCARLNEPLLLRACQCGRWAYTDGKCTTIP